jgi:hypothetical protein
MGVEKRRSKNDFAMNDIVIAAELIGARVRFIYQVQNLHPMNYPCLTLPTGCDFRSQSFVQRTGRAAVAAILNDDTAAGNSVPRYPHLLL